RGGAPDRAPAAGGTPRHAADLAGVAQPRGDRRARLRRGGHPAAPETGQRRGPARRVHVLHLHPALVRDRHGDLSLPAAQESAAAGGEGVVKAGEGVGEVGATWTCACSPSGPSPRTRTSPAATAPTGR